MKRRTPSGESLTSVSYKRERIDNVAGVKMAGPYLIGPRISQSPVSSIVQCLGRKIGTDDFYMLKILTMENSDRESQDDKQGKMLLHTEYSLLSLLHNQGGVVHHHGLFKKNIVHRDLKLGNMMLNKRSLRVTITNFCLGKHLVCEDDPLKDQRGSPAYISPDVLSGKPYLGKPSDMWALGVVLFTMLYGQFPFYDSDPIKLFKKIKTADFTIPPLGVQDSTSGLIKQLLVLDPKERLTASQVLEALHGIITTWRAMYNRSGPLQVVPDIDDLIPSTLKNPPMNRKFPSGLSEFEKKLKEYNESEKDHPRAKVKKLIQLQRKPNVPPPIRRLNEDAQAMTSMEVRAHRHLVHPQ
ncbi:unnamed protein product [Owenia fusiformis]|uniref:Serine/threonine-protein kinase 40 n=1 Tax=Owenia fusiformis TaxID=6347 RepID=A0A8J1TAD6_OWEFU|nr:unnamed protein product [Owenia fusiformis]